MASAKAKKISIFFIVIILLLAVLGVIKYFQIQKQIAAFKKMAPPPATISTTTVQKSTYTPTAPAVGTFQAVNGVEVTPQVSGEVVQIGFHSGELVHMDQPLVLLDDRAAKSDYDKAEAALNNAHMTMLRDQRLIKVHAIGQSTYDTDLMMYKQAQATADGAKVILDNHIIKAPFTGKIGIKQINIGQYLTPGIAIATLQTQNPIHLNFNLPEKDMADLKLGTQVDATVDRYPNMIFHGMLTAINSTIDPATHTIALQATYANARHDLFPGGFAQAQVHLGKGHAVITIPNTAVTYRLYGDSVYVVTTTATGHEATLKYITVGDPIGTKDVAIVKGLKAGDVVVTAGQNKLQEKNPVLINNNVPKTGDFVKKALK